MESGNVRVEEMYRESQGLRYSRAYVKISNRASLLGNGARFFYRAKITREAVLVDPSPNAFLSRLEGSEEPLSSPSTTTVKPEQKKGWRPLTDKLGVMLPSCDT